MDYTQPQMYSDTIFVPPSSMNPTISLLRSGSSSKQCRRFSSSEDLILAVITEAEQFDQTLYPIYKTRPRETLYPVGSGPLVGCSICPRFSATSKLSRLVEHIKRRVHMGVSKEEGRESRDLESAIAESTLTFCTIASGTTIEMKDPSLGPNEKEVDSTDISQSAQNDLAQQQSFSYNVPSSTDMISQMSQGEVVDVMNRVIQRSIASLYDGMMTISLHSLTFQNDPAVHNLYQQSLQNYQILKEQGEKFPLLQEGHINWVNDADEDSDSAPQRQEQDDDEADQLLGEKRQRLDPIADFNLPPVSPMGYVSNIQNQRMTFPPYFNQVQGGPPNIFIPDMKSAQQQNLPIILPPLPPIPPMITQPKAKPKSTMNLQLAMEKLPPSPFISNVQHSSFHRPR
ncbi:hypothetical protein BLNAU_11905 [Blattamonas nauphoetae]|uniref:C2H2-type domain-containing protein n=1 Tax=Blattamonas nauphoetae TaxID=2049346 RepID=A0ABQ9XNN4_9EUKA|nr:hypothetical protein BLNAU_11905 [Blattamonas nauphoetae]